MATGSKHCPAQYVESFVEDWLSGLTTNQLRAKYLRPDGQPYHRRTVNHWIKNLGLRNQQAVDQVSASEAVEAAISDEKSRLDSILAKREERRLLREAAQLDRVLQVIKEEMPRLSTVPQIILPATRPKLTDEEEDVLCFISDVQMGERVEREPTSGLGFYNVDAFHERANRYYETVTQLIDMHRTAADIKTMHILFGGDIVEGSQIYPSQPFHIDEASVPQCLRVVETFSDMLAQFAARGLKVRIYGIPGNHGRLTKKGQEPYMNNLDTLCYHMMRYRLENHPNITWHISNSWLQLFRIKGHLYSAEHGDMVRGSLSIPLYGLLRRHNRLITLTGEIIEAHFIGHHHTPTSAESGFGCKVFINGSWVGTSDFSAHALGVGNAPSQLLLGINHRHGIAWERQIYLAQPSEIRKVVITDVEAEDEVLAAV